MLLDAAEKLIGFEFVFAGTGAAQQAYVEHDDVAAAGLQAVEDIAEVVDEKSVEVVTQGDDLGHAEL